MDVSGRKRPTKPVMLCQPCQADGDTSPAEGFCENCNEFVCSSCIKAHRKLTVTKKHVIISRDEMPKCQIARSALCTELCDDHKKEIIKFYCKEHDAVGCGDCMVLEHKLCNVQLVSDVSCNYDDGDELVLIKHRIDHLKKNIDSCKREIEFSLKTAIEEKTRIIKEINQCRKEMDAYLDKVTKELIQEVENLCANDIARQQTLQDRCKTTAEYIERVQRKFEKIKDNINDLFVFSKQMQTKLQKSQEINEDISSKSQINIFKFTPAEVHSTCLGTLDTKVKKFSGQCNRPIFDMKPQFVNKAKLRGNQEATCGIKGMTIISEDVIVCADAENKSLKVFNHKEGKLISTFKTPCSPTDVTTIKSSLIAATLYEEGKILFLYTQKELTISHIIKVRKNCFGIDHRNGIMAVAFVDPPAVQVIDMEGHVLHEVRDTGILKRPNYVCFSDDNEGIFVSDWQNHAVYEFSLKGHLRNKFEYDNMKIPIGLKATNGNVVICDPNNSVNVAVIVPGTRANVPIYVQHVLNPWSVLICKEQNRMFISEHAKSKDANYIKVFDLK